MAPGELVPKSQIFIQYISVILAVIFRVLPEPVNRLSQGNEKIVTITQMHIYGMIFGRALAIWFQKPNI